jgi:hypothetical protein
MEFLQTYASLIGSIATIAFGYGVLNNKVKSIELQIEEHESVLKSQAIILQQIAVDVAIIRTRLEEIKKK